MPYLTPETNPTDIICRVLLIPNDPLFIANVTGALEELTFAYNWEKFGAITVDDAKIAMLTMFNSYCFGEVGDCLPTPLFRQHDDCLLQMSGDGGATWDTVFDASSCVDVLVRSGRYSGLGPQQPVTTAVHGNCTTMGITLYANSVFQWPQLINTGDIITVQVFEDHGWSGTLNVLSDTHCSDGAFLDSFLQCGGSADPGHTGDPLPAANHMRLVMNVDGVWEDAYNLSSTVRSGVSNGVLTVQANDDILLDNAGWIGVHIEVCTSGFTHDFDFTADDGGFTIADGAGWVSGQGWTPTRQDVNDFDGGAFRTFSARTITSIKLYYDYTGPGGANSSAEFVYYLSGSLIGVPTWSTVAGPTMHEENPNISMDKLYFYVNGGHDGSAGKITRLIVQGTGTDPF